MTNPRFADDFDGIRARMEELRRERAQVPAVADSRPDAEPPADAASNDRPHFSKRGIPGWRVPVGKRQSSS